MPLRALALNWQEAQTSTIPYTKGEWRCARNPSVRRSAGEPCRFTRGLGGPRIRAKVSAGSMRLSVLSLALALGAAGCSRSTATREQQAKKPAEVLFPVEVRAVAMERVEYRVVAVGAVEAFENVQVTARVPGVLEKLHFKEGDAVKDGALLAEIEPQRYQLAVASAQGALARAQASKGEAERELERAKNLAAEGVSSGVEVSTWQTKLATAMAAESESRAALGVASLNLRDARLKAPLAGSIQSRSVQTGQYVQAGTVIATLIRRDPLLLRFRVTEAEAARLALGMTAEFRVTGAAGAQKAKITFIAASAEAASRMVPVVAEVAEDPSLRPGAFAEVTVPVGVNDAALAVPETAIRPSERGFIAFVVEGNVAHERIVDLGLRTPNGLVEVVKGLRAGESLVVRGGEALREGAKVRVGGARPSAPIPPSSAARAP
jgi:multidrug efflux system membrane fusion protein